MLELDRLSASYGKAMALESISLRVMPGEFVAVLGPNGAGKSTLLKAISRAIDSQGGLTFEGQSLHNVATEKWWAWAFAIALKDAACSPNSAY